MITVPEFSRPVRIDTIGAEPRRMEVSAEPEEREAMARRFGLVAIHSLSAEAALSRNGESVIAEGRLKAEVTQSCVATAAPIDVRLDEPFRIEFRPQPAAVSPDDEIELSEEELDVVFYDSASIDLGEAVAETLSLSLDPYPRARGADDALKAAGVKGEAEAGPFAALAALKDKLTK